MSPAANVPMVPKSFEGVCKDKKIPKETCGSDSKKREKLREITKTKY